MLFLFNIYLGDHGVPIGLGWDLVYTDDTKVIEGRDVGQWIVRRLEKTDPNGLNEREGKF